MSRFSGGAGRTGYIAGAGGWVANRSVTINQPGVGDYVNPRKLFIPANARPGVRNSTLFWMTGSSLNMAQSSRGTNALPSVMNNTGHISINWPATDLTPNMSTFGMNVYCQHFPGDNGAGDEWPNRQIGLQAFDALYTADLLQYPMDGDKLVGIGFSAGCSMLYSLAAKYPERWAGLVFLDSPFVKGLLADATHEGSSPDGTTIARAADIPTDASAATWMAQRCGHIPTIVVYSNEFVNTLGTSLPFTRMLSAYAAAGETVASFTQAFPTLPAIQTTDKYCQVYFNGGATHQNIINNFPVLSNTALWNWIAARRRGE